MNIILRYWLSWLILNWYVSLWFFVSRILDWRLYRFLIRLFSWFLVLLFDWFLNWLLNWFLYRFLYWLFNWFVIFILNFLCIWLVIYSSSSLFKQLFESFILSLKLSNQFIRLTFIYNWFVFNFFSSLSISQSGKSFVIIIRSRRNGTNHDCLRVTTQCILENSR